MSISDDNDAPQMALRVQKEFAALGAEYEGRSGALSSGQGLLRPRYASDWVPSWEGSTRIASDCEDRQFSQIMDATRLSDGLYVSLKMVEKSEYPDEAEIGLYFISDKLVSDPKNHCVPFFEVLSIIVMPLLLNFVKEFDTTMLYTGTCPGINSDCTWMNIMMDVKNLYAEPYHTVKPHMKRDFSGPASPYTRTRRPPKHYIIDFGLSRRYDANEENPLEYPIFGVIRRCQNFKIIRINVIREQFLNTKAGFELLKSLVDDMVQDDPSKRPTMEQVGRRSFEHIYHGAAHWRRQICFIVKRVSAVPRLAQ
ncbi:hypothetical protein BDR07DRAFT_1451981 [Suillus spraguei]|nr:hypothetical protein BDR07DRAFT_1451981 [Suillus spraguei]